ncbi:MAG: AAA family ATPase [Candidatus Lokiarchaeota archaeon]|nr:AAA family ATPase [Candidatus Lokiarchaeota archaeon]
MHLNKTVTLQKTVQKKLSAFFDDNKKNYIKIGILGTHGTGKTTLGHTIMSYLKENHFIVGWVSEIVRDRPAAVKDLSAFLSQYWVLNSQINKEIERQSLNKVIVTDRTVIDNFAYAKKSAANSISKKDLKVLEHICKNWSSTYDFLFYTQITKKPIEDDNFRSTNQRYQLEIDRMIRNIIKEWELEVVELSGKYDERFDRVLETLNNNPKLNLKKYIK